ncbi:hypothetical protein AB6A40_011621 [Gnathostoma spinigerum]|uniref:Uncharacterized protein n=1 Tax=Gnathostoma spinigerum TaxID=75299 RepID=A0ABD6F0A4_9BILA
MRFWKSWPQRQQKIINASSYQTSSALFGILFMEIEEKNISRLIQMDAPQSSTSHSETEHCSNEKARAEALNCRHLKEFTAKSGRGIAKFTRDSMKRTIQ